MEKLLNKINLFYKLAQMTSAQPGEVETALKNANLWELSKEVSPLVAAAQVPDNAAINLQIVVSPGPKISFNSLLEPGMPPASGKLSALLAKKYSAIMSAALAKVGLNVEEPIVVGWLTF